MGIEEKKNQDLTMKSIFMNDIVIPKVTAKSKASNEKEVNEKTTTTTTTTATAGTTKTEKESNAQWAVELFGKTLHTKEGEKDSDKVLAGKYVGIYFSAHWCPPCRGFTPVFAKAYDAHYKKKDFECVFVSSDQDEGSFNGYYKEMPWVALPFKDRKGKEKLSGKYGVRGIPSLIILDKNGEIITKDGREKVTGDEEGKNFPWKA